MNNEQTLILSYFLVGTLCLLLSMGTYAILRRSFEGLNWAVPGGGRSLLFNRLFFPGILLPAMAGFFSVSFRSCSRDTYEAIIADRFYLIAKNQEQVGTSLMYVVAALLVWGVLVAIQLAVAARKTEDRS